MSTASELLNEAQFALQNAGSGSTDSKKNMARARTLAQRIISRYPDSTEASAAKSILRQLGESFTAKVSRNHHTHTSSGDRHQAQHFGKSPGIRPQVPQLRVADRASAGFATRNFLPGWPLRLVQAISVYAGIVLVLRGLFGLSSTQSAVAEALIILVGASFIYAPRSKVFAELVGFLRMRIFTSEDWYADADEMPTQKDISELFAALVSGGLFRRLLLLFAFLFVGGFALLLAAVFYVVGVRKAFDLLEGWLLDRKPLSEEDAGD